jgi:hypothetical protein
MGVQEKDRRRKLRLHIRFAEAVENLAACFTVAAAVHLTPV